MLVAALLIGSETISFSCPPSNLSDLRPRLEATFGTKVEIDPVFRDEVVVIEVTDVPLEDLKAKIADVVCGEWDATKPDRIRLVLDLDEEDRRFQDSLGRAAKSIEKHIAEERERGLRYATPRPTPKELADRILAEGRMRGSLYAAMPYFSLQNEVLASLDPKEIALAMYEGGATYALNDPLARKLPRGTDKLVEETLKNIAETGGYLFERGFQPQTGFGSGLFAIDKFMYPKVDGFAGNYYVQVLDLDDLSIGFHLFDQSGKGIAESGMAVRMDSGWSPIQQIFKLQSRLCFMKGM